MMRRRVPSPALVLSCEHGGNRVPPAFRAIFREREALLASHRGFDPGSLSLARALARAFGAPLVAATVSRLVVELNRSPGHPDLFSAPMRGAGRAVCEAAFRTHYLPYRLAVGRLIAATAKASHPVIHVSVHSFTPVLDGVERRADVGLLYDPARRGERRLCAAWQAALQDLAPGCRVRRNYPYRGNADGLTTALRREWPAKRYVGIELEVNQALYYAGQRAWSRVRRTLVVSLREAMARATR